VGEPGQSEVPAPPSPLPFDLLEHDAKAVRGALDARQTHGLEPALRRRVVQGLRPWGHGLADSCQEPWSHARPSVHDGQRRDRERRVLEWPPSPTARYVDHAGIDGQEVVSHDGEYS